MKSPLSNIQRFGKKFCVVSPKGRKTCYTDMYSALAKMRNVNVFTKKLKGKI
jgi:hypothetical protein